MKIIARVQSPNFLIYSGIFLVTQLAGVLLGLVICYVLQDFIGGFIRVALVNSLLLGGALVGSCWFIQKMMFRMKIVYSLAISFTLLSGTGISSLLLLLYREPVLFLYYSRGLFAFLLVNFLFITALYVISAGFIIYREILLVRERAIATERDLKNRMEQKMLVSKVNPHFLFNTLNMICNLLKQPQKAETALLNLSDLLRHNLEQSEKDTIPVSQEIDNVRKYLELQQLRFDGRLEFSIAGNADFPVPPLVIQPLVENCIKHNIREVERLRIEVTITREGNRGSIRVADSERKLVPSMTGRGQGLIMTKKRIENMNGVFSIENGEVVVSFQLR